MKTKPKKIKDNTEATAEAKKKFKLTPKLVILTALALVITLSAVVTVCAYFSSRIKLVTDDGNSKYFRMGMELNTFFDIIDSDEVETGTNLNILCANSDYADYSGKLTTETVDEVMYYTYNPDATWGSASNPYIISSVTHLQNLYVLQNCGYFTSLTYNNSDAGHIKEWDMPYFLICTPEGEPTVICGTDKTFEFIGDERYPFIGYVGGAFTEGTTTVDGKTSVQSVIQDIVVKTDDDVIDVGLFGHIGYLGNDDDVDDEGNFTGAVSTIRDLLLYDVRVVIEEKSFWTAVTDTVAHVFTFGDLSDDIAAVSPHENHHVGILAGHVEHTTLEYISIYYSSEDIAAIDISQVTKDANGVSANYYSVSGIVGYAYAMNSNIGKGVVSAEGIGNSDIEVSSGGVGTGGGLESGSGRGYVSAADIFKAYDDSGEIVKCTIPVTETNNDGTEYTTDTYRYGLVIEYDKSNPLTYNEDGDITYWSLTDKETAVVIQSSATYGYVARIYDDYESFIGTSKSSYQDWPSFVIHDNSDGKYYYYKNGVKTAVSQVETTGISLRYAAKYNTDEDTFTKLCTQYERSRIGSTITGWTQTTDRCYFYDGVFTFALSDPTDTIEKTWTGTTADTFYVGSTDTSKWTTNTDNGNKAIVSYIKQLTTVSELQALEASGKKVYIIYEGDDDNGNTKEYLVTLAKNSTYSAGKGEDALYTDLTALEFVDTETSESLKKSIENNTFQSPVSGVSNATLAANWDSYKILNVGNSEDTEMSLTKLRTYYNIDVAYTTKEAETSYYDEHGNVFPSASNLTVTAGTGITETVTHQWDGYWIWHRESTFYNWATWYYNVFEYVSASTGQTIYSYGDRTTTGAKGDVKVSASSYFGTGTTQYGATVYTKEGYTGRVFYKNQTLSSYYNEGMSRTTGSKYAGLGSEAAMSQSSYTLTYTYFTADETTSGTVYKYLGSGNPLASAPTATSSTTTVNGVTYTVYTDGTHTGILLSQNTTGGYYTFSSTRDGTKYTLRMLRRAYTISTRYSILCADDTYATTKSNFINELNWTPTSLANSTEANVVPVGDGTGRFYISYTVNGNTRYLAFGADVDGADGPCFHGTSSKSSACAMYIYTVEGSQDISYGTVTYEPVGTSGTDYWEYSASDYVLWPNSVYKSGDSSTSAYKPSSDTSYTADPTYQVRKLSDMIMSGWKTSTGKALGYDSLSSVFSLGDGISDINIVSLWGGESSTNFNSEYIKAPVGTTGEEAYIPTGCVAFRITNSGSTQKIRVIVAVPQSDYYYGQSISGNIVNPDEIDYSEDYYFCMWKCGEAGSSTTTSINLDNCVEAFELPRSNPYQPGTTAASSELYAVLKDGNSKTVSGSSDGASVKNYVTVNSGGSDYRAYLNGNEVLVAYEFSATEEGVYVLGSNKECSIVFFSADSTASAGDDGTIASYKLGTIDYVYDNGSSDGTVAATKIITVKERAPAGTATKDSSLYYYSSLVLLYTDNTGAVSPLLDGDTDVTNGFFNINDFVIYIRRKRIDNTSGIYWQAKGSQELVGGVTDADYIQCVRYSFDADTVTRTDSALRS